MDYQKFCEEFYVHKIKRFDREKEKRIQIDWDCTEEFIATNISKNDKSA